MVCLSKWIKSWWYQRSKITWSHKHNAALYRLFICWFYLCWDELTGVLNFRNNSLAKALESTLSNYLVTQHHQFFYSSPSLLFPPITTSAHIPKSSAPCTLSLLLKVLPFSHQLLFSSTSECFISAAPVKSESEHDHAQTKMYSLKIFVCCLWRWVRQLYT